MLFKEVIRKDELLSESKESLKLRAKMSHKNL